MSNEKIQNISLPPNKLDEKLAEMQRKTTNAPEKALTSPRRFGHRCQEPAHIAYSCGTLVPLVNSHFITYLEQQASHLKSRQLSS